ncbi:MAG: alpha/beta hydrolase family protein [Proteobacteria bacterium]|nr:alpha/beta hydrolase family protein [Pseudomonadota bacterium]
MQTEARLPAGPAFSLFKGQTGKLILRPWFDAVAVRAVTNWYLPLSRAWAAGVAAEGDLDRFAAAAGADRTIPAKFGPILTELDISRRQHDDALTRWEEAFFADGDVAEAELIASATERLRVATHFMGLRRKFLSARRLFSQVDWSVATSSDVMAAQGARLLDPKSAFPSPAIPPVHLSKLASGVLGREGWLRMKSPSTATNDTAWAHVFWPEGEVRGTIVSLHGVLMEQDTWPIADPVSQMVEDGFCVIRAEGPWHGRRCPAGQYGGEAIFARGILGFIELFEAWVAETALWINWARAEIGGPVGLSGISLGALTAQLVVAHCGQWPRDMRPDAALLITTTGDVINGALRGSLASMLNIRIHLSAGWREDDIASWRPLIEPGGRIALDPSAIVLALGDADTVTPYQGGKALAAQWGVSAENLLVKHQGHFSAALGLYQDRAPLNRLARILTP